VADGVVRIRNHGTDHANPHVIVADSPLYARLGYSTHTFPDLAPESLDNAVVLVDAGGRLTHRTGFELLGQKDSAGVLVGASRARAHWIEVDSDGGADHGSGAAGTATAGPEVTVVSLTRGAVEVRLVRLRGTDGSALLRIGGWPVDAHSTLTSEIIPLAGYGNALDASGTWTRTGPHPMGNRLDIPWIGTTGAALDGDYAGLVVLAGEANRQWAESVRFLDTGIVDFGDGHAVDVASLWSELQEKG